MTARTSIAILQVYRLLYSTYRVFVRSPSPGAGDILFGAEPLLLSQHYSLFVWHQPPVLSKHLSSHANDTHNGPLGIVELYKGTRHKYVYLAAKDCNNECSADIAKCSVELYLRASKPIQPYPCPP